MLHSTASSRLPYHQPKSCRCFDGKRLLNWQHDEDRDDFPVRMLVFCLVLTPIPHHAMFSGLYTQQRILRLYGAHTHTRIVLMPEHVGLEDLQGSWEGRHVL